MERLSRSNVIERELSGERDVSLQLSAADDSSSAAAQSQLPKFENKIMHKGPKIWAVGSGKGGVGKSLLSASLSVSLAKRGFKVLALDLDIGGSNLHTCLGVNPPKVGLGDWASGRAPSLDHVMVDSELPNLKVVSGANDTTKITTIMQGKTEHLMSQLRQSAFDHVVIDLGAGTYDLTTEFFLAADQGLISILPEPTSVENAYRFIRAVLFRKMKESNVPDGIKEVIEAASDPKNILGIKTPHDLIAVVARIDEVASQTLQKVLQDFHPAIVINQVRSQVDVDVGKAIIGVCRRFFGIDVKYPGYIDYDGAVWKSVRNRRPAILEFPRSVLANRIENLTKALLNEK